MADVRDLTVRINGDASGYTKTVDQVAGSNDKVESSFSKLTKAFVFGNVLYSVGANVAVRFKDALNDVVQQANEAAKANAQLNAVIQSTGGVAGVTAESAKKLSEAIRDHSTIDDTAVLSAENMLLTFRDIGKNIFPTATQAVTDMATAMNGGATPGADKLRDTAIQVGKALQDPIKGVTTLRRVGVQLSDQQQQQIKDFIAVNDKADAQKVILGELQKEFGGSAAAAADTFSGKLQQLKNKMDDFGKSVVLNIEGTLNKDLPVFENFASAVGRLADKIWQFLKPSFEALWDTITTKIMPALGNLWHNIIEPLMPIIGTLLVAAIWGVTNGLNLLLQIITPVINFIADHRVFVELLAGAFVTLQTSMALGAAFDAIKVGFATFQLVTIPSMMASLSALGAAFVAAVPVAAIFAALALVTAKIMQTKALLDTLNNQEANDISSGQQAMQQIIDEANSGKITHQKAAEILRGLNQTRAAGGPITAGIPYLVGEKGPEIVVPQRSGTVIPNNKLSSGGGQNLTLNVNVGMYAGMPVEKRQIALDLYKELVRAARSQGISLPMIGAVGVQ